MNVPLFGPASESPQSQDERADEILAAALVAFGENGFADTTLTDIARGAGVSTSTVLRYFRSKDEVFREVVRSTLIGSLSMSFDAPFWAQELSDAVAVGTLALRLCTTISKAIQ